MSQNNYSHEPASEEQDLREIEEALSALASEGELEFPVPEYMATKVAFSSPGFPDRLWAKIRAQDQIRQHLKAARRAIPEGNYSFAQLLRMVRSEAGISLEDVAQALRMRLVEVEALESSQADPLELPTETIANLMEVFSIPIVLLERSLRVAIARRFSRAELLQPYGSSTVANGEEAITEANLPSGYLEKVEYVLRRRGREDLLCGFRFSHMSDLEAYRTALISILRQRKEAINVIPLKRKKSRTPTGDKNLISAAVLFEQWGFMDYIAARTLLLKVLDASLQPELPRKVDLSSSVSEQLRNRDRSHVVGLLAAGELIWPACALAATAAEKYCKAIITIAQKKLPKPTHLTRSLIDQVGNCVKNLFRVVNQRFVEDLRMLYDLRYHTNAQGAPHAVIVSVRGMLAELDFTIAQLDGCLQITNNGIPQDSSYMNARHAGSQDLHRGNHILMGMDKVAFWRQHDLQGALSSVGDPHDTVRGWMPVNNGASAEFFFVVHRDLAADPSGVQARKDEYAQMASLLKREAAIMHYV